MGNKEQEEKQEMRSFKVELIVDLGINKIVEVKDCRVQLSSGECMMTFISPTCGHPESPDSTSDKDISLYY